MEKNEALYKQIIKWSCEYLMSHGHALKSPSPEEVQCTPWSYVVRFMTSEGYVYLKHTPPLLALEADILTILYDQLNAPVPEIIAHNKQLDCFLMKGAGKPLSDILKKQFNVELFCKAMNEFVTMQVSAENYVTDFIAIGVPDWRLNKLTGLFTQLLTKKYLLLEDGLLESEIRELKKFIPVIANLCDKLLTYSIRQTIVQPDFNDNNTLIDSSQKITIIDLGEIVISHPFFSLFNSLQQMEKHYSLTVNSADYLKMRDTYLAPYRTFESHENLLKAFKLARPLWCVYGALASDRLIEACGKSEIMSYQRGKLINNLKTLISEHAN